MFRQPWKTGSETLNEGVQNLMERLMKQKQYQEENAYKNALLGIAKQKLPYELRELAAKTSKEEEELESQRSFRNMWNDAQQPTTNEISTNNKPGETYNYGGSQPDQVTDRNISLNQGSYNPNDNQQNIDQNQIPLDAKSLQERIDNGEEVVIRQPRNPKLARFDQFAGMEIPGTKVKLPAIKSWTDKNGLRHDRYPSGKEIVQKEGLSETEKANVQLDVAEKREQSKANTKRTEVIKDTTKSLIDSFSTLKTMNDLLLKNKDLTGIRYNAPFGVGGLLRKAGSSELGEFDTASGKLQTQYAKMEKSQPGIGLINFYTKIKPDAGNSQERNVGMIKEHTRELINQFNQQKEDWESIHPGKKFPYELPKYVNDLANGVDTISKNEKVLNGKTYKKINGIWHEAKG